MAKEIMPAWQQVLLIALNNVPKTKTGYEAWEKLNAEEQSAVLDFLTEHCGENAQAALEDACGKIQRPVWWRWLLWGLLWAADAVAWVALVQWAEKLLDWDLSPVFWALLALMNIHTGLLGSPVGKMQEMWKEHVATHYGTTLALNDMYKHCNLPRRERISKGMVICWAVLLVCNVFLFVGEIAEHRGPSVPQQIVSVLEDTAEGKASLEDAEALLEGWSDLRQKDHVASAWEKTAKWSDERYLAAALAVRLGLETAPDYAREALLTTRLGAIDTPAESAEFAALLALCDAETVQAVRERVEAAEFPEKAAVLAAFE